ncbi:ATP-binding cassette domain-containing protein [Amphritea balenae]|uniref:ATP-binding cassette domain-containing protein n=1 Tax=Amphritea balenae TaxID=452629 RepID=A0A3P1SSH3_9GAMM|nr:ATP-binding cassette domain-containing protein [Amphritea balenae]RRC99565.1 ATP-binding cassette domain-containing protein [Amphritea balenae]GGK78077.1 phosphonates import ATP-binding protein PhnC [Amphritea balenae]
MTAIHLTDISVSYDNRQVLGPLSLELKPGEIVVVIGKSGCGKSTLLSQIYDRLRHRAAWLPQDLGLVDTLSVYHNVYMAQLDQHSRWYNIINLIRPFSEQVDNVRPWLKRMSIDDKIWQSVDQLSGGQKQRVAIARALHQGAEILLADEPVSALDGPKADQVMACLTQQYSTALIALHDVDLALRYGQRIIGISDGRIMLDQPVQKLSQQSLLEFY